MSRLMPSQFPSEKWLISLIPLLSHLFLNKTGGMQCGISLWLVGIIHLVMSPHKLLFNPNCIHWRGRMRNRGGFDAVQALLTVAKILVCYQYCFVISIALVTNPKHRTTAAAMKITNFILTRPSTSSHRRLKTNSIYLEKQGSLKKRIETTQLNFYS